MVIERVQQVSVEAFLDFAESSEDWHEFIDGEPYKMTAASYKHNVICNNLVLRLGFLLADMDCQVLGAGQGVKCAEMVFLIPDMCVVWERPLLDADSRLLLNPILVVEVTSPTSIERDRHLKRDLYWAVESIQAYLVIDQHRPLVDLFARGETNWTLRRFSDMGDEIPLEALNCRLPLREIYRRIDFE